MPTTRPARSLAATMAPDPRRRQRRSERLDLPVAGPSPDRPAAAADPPSASSRRRWPGSATRLGAGRLYGDAVRLLRLRPRRRQHAAAGRARLRAPLRRRRGDPRLRREPTGACGWSRRPASARSSGAWRGRAGERDRSADAAGFDPGDRGAVPAQRHGRRSTAGSIRSRAAEAASADLPKSLRDAIERMARRMRGDYHEDEWGFDEEFAEAAYPFFELLYDQLVAGRGDRRRERPRARPGDARLQPRRRALPVRRLDDHRRDHEGAPAAPLAAVHGPRLGLLACRSSRRSCARSAAFPRAPTTRRGSSNRTA